MFLRVSLCFRELRSLSSHEKVAARAAAGGFANQVQERLEKNTANRKPFSSATSRSSCRARCHCSAASDEQCSCECPCAFESFARSRVTKKSPQGPLPEVLRIRSKSDSKRTLLTGSRLAVPPAAPLAAPGATAQPLRMSSVLASVLELSRASLVLRVTKKSPPGPLPDVLQSRSKGASRRTLLTGSRLAVPPATEVLGPRKEEG